MWSWPIRVSRWKCDESIPSARGKDMNTPFHLVKANLFFRVFRFANLTALSLSLVMTRLLEPKVCLKEYGSNQFSCPHYGIHCAVCVLCLAHIRLLAANKANTNDYLAMNVTGLVTAVPVWRVHGKGSQCLQTPDSKVIFRRVFPESKSSNSYKTSVLPHVLQTC